MLESPAYRALTLSEHRILSRLEIELAHHGGADNGQLPATYDDFEQYGVHRHAIGPGLRALVALGFIEITEAGRAGNAEWRRANLFRLTFRKTKLLNETYEWLRIETIEEAEVIADAARKASPAKQKPSGGKRTITSGGKRTTDGRFHSAETATTTHSTESATTLDISGGVPPIPPADRKVPAADTARAG
jgi:hypothetical protein